MRRTPPACTLAHGPNSDTLAIDAGAARSDLDPAPTWPWRPFTCKATAFCSTATTPALWKASATTTPSPARSFLTRTPRSASIQEARLTSASSRKLDWEPARSSTAQAPNSSVIEGPTGNAHSFRRENTYTGATLVNQGVLQIQNSQALGGAANGTTVLDGAQLQLQAPATGPNAGQPLAITGENLVLSGAGIAGTGALLNSGGNNSWNYNGLTGTVMLASDPVLLLPNNTPATIPPGDISIDVANAADTLTINAPIGQTGSTFGLKKIGVGRLTADRRRTPTPAPPRPAMTPPWPRAPCAFKTAPAWAGRCWARRLLAAPPWKSTAIRRGPTFSRSRRLREPWR